jgi:DNA polymerase-3 subunit delta'
MHPWNEPILESFRKTLGRLPHALLVYGPRGVGKLALAERAAQLFLCEGKNKPCGSCDGCRWYLSGNHPDFRRIEPEALAAQPGPGEEDAPARKTKQPSIEIKIDQVRELAGFLNVGSHRGGRRVVLVHPAEHMNIPTANALLKDLEEPPAGAVFILVSHRPALLLPTVRSRCVAVPVPVPPRAAALEWMGRQRVAQPERWLAYAGGAPLRAMDYAGEGEALDRLLRSPAPADDREGIERLAEALQKIALDRALAAFGLPPKYQASTAKVPRDAAKAWLAFAREMGEKRLLSRHPLAPRLFSAEMLGTMPDLT